MEAFTLDETHGVYWLQAWKDQFPDLKVGFTSRHLGERVSAGNLALHIEDDVEHVLRNREFLSQINDVTIEAMTCAQQTHGSRVQEVTLTNRSAGAHEFATSIPDTDGLITQLPNTMLTLFFADCVPLYFVDPVQRAVGIAHAGWRGSVKNIAGEMVRKFQEQYSSKPDNIYVAIGPSIGACCYQVDQVVMNEVEKKLPYRLNDVARADGKEHYRLDLKKMNQILLEQAGILSNHIEVSQLCTSCNVHQFFSYRKELGKAGRMAAFAVWEEEELCR